MIQVGVHNQRRVNCCIIQMRSLLKNGSSDYVFNNNATVNQTPSTRPAPVFWTGCRVGLRKKTSGADQAGSFAAEGEIRLRGDGDRRDSIAPAGRRFNIPDGTFRRRKRRFGRTVRKPGRAADRQKTACCGGAPGLFPMRKGKEGFASLRAALQSLRLLNRPTLLRFLSNRPFKMH